eukprot:RCo014011
MGKNKKRVPLAVFEEKKAKADNQTVCFAGKQVPHAILVQIYSFLGYHDVRVAARISRGFRSLGDSQELWHELFLGKVKCVFDGETHWRKFFGVGEEKPASKADARDRGKEKDKHVNWKQNFTELAGNLQHDESFLQVKGAHLGCSDPYTPEDRKARILPVTGVNNLVFSLPGSKTIPSCLLFSSSRPTVGSGSAGGQATLRLWSVGPWATAPSPVGENPFDLLHRGPAVGVEGMLYPSKYIVHSLSTRQISESVCKTFPVYTYFKEDEKSWEYACVAGDEAGQVSFYTGSCGSETITLAARPPSLIFSTKGRVVALKCMLEEPGFSGFKQAFGCGSTDSGYLYDLQTNKVIVEFPHEDGLYTDVADVSTDVHLFALGQVSRKSGSPQALVRLFEAAPDGVRQPTSFPVAGGAVKCVRFCTLPNADSGDCFLVTSRDGLCLWDKRTSKLASRVSTQIPLEQFCVVSARSLVACTSGPDMLLYELRVGRQVRKLTHGHSWCSAITCDSEAGTPTSGVVVTSGTEGSIRFWHVNQVWRSSRDEPKKRGGAGPERRSSEGEAGRGE